MIMFQTEKKKTYHRTHRDSSKNGLFSCDVDFEFINYRVIGKL